MQKNTASSQKSGQGGLQFFMGAQEGIVGNAILIE
jgi:hypothetical protein